MAFEQHFDMDMGYSRRCGYRSWDEVDEKLAIANIERA